jgi:uncharacterized protein with HXXEE motif
MRWHYRDPPLLWLLVAAYACHVAEEWFGGFPEWFAVVGGRTLPRDAFVAINAVGLAVMVAATWAAARRDASGWLAIAVASLLFINALAHVAGSIVTRSYSPGLISSVVVYLPLTQLVLVRAWHQVPSPLFWRAVAAGALAHAVVTTIAVAVAY